MPTPEQHEWLGKLGINLFGAVPPPSNGSATAPAATTAPLAQIPVPQVSGDGKDTLVKAMTPLDTMAASPTQKGMFTIILDGKPTSITEAQATDARTKARDALKRNIVAVKVKAESAMTRYAEQKKVNDDQWAVSAAVTAMKKVTTLGKFADPGPSLKKLVEDARTAIAGASSALDSGAFVKSAAAFADAEIAATKAEQMAIGYSEGMIDGAGSSITVLERTRDVSAITVAVLATIATAGAASGAIGATTTAFGVEVGTATAANVIATAAPIAGSVAMATTQMAIGDKVDWGNVAIDAVIQLLLSKFGGPTTKGISAAVAKQLAAKFAAKRIAQAAVEKMVQGLILQEASATLHTVAESVYAELRGKNMTWGQFFKTLIERLTDPRGLAVAAVVAALTTGAEAKYGGTPAATGGNNGGDGGKPPPAGGNSGGGNGGKGPSNKLFPDLSDAEIGAAVDNAKSGPMQRIEPVENITDADVEAGIDRATAGPMQRTQPIENITNEEMDAAIDNARAGTMMELPGQDPANPNRGLVGVEIRQNENAPIAHHDNMTFRDVEGVPPGDDLQVRRHSGNANAPAGSYSRDNPTTQINTVDPATPMQSKTFRLPDGTYKRFADMTEEEKAASHME